MALIVGLKEKPILHPEAYCLRKKVYGFDVQAVCDWRKRFLFIYIGYTASAHSSKAFKSSLLHTSQEKYFEEDEFVLTDKAYELGHHVIVPYKNRLEDPNPDKNMASFNLQHSRTWVTIEHAFLE